jgi:FkbM family methyltransferase
MVKKFSYIIYKFLLFVDEIIKLIFNKSFLIWFKDFIEKNSYKKITVLNKNLIFFTPNYLTSWRVDSINESEPETLDWINSFKKKKEVIFWDIGANIGIYSIYAATKHKNIKVVSFEPSTSNLRILSRNISINNFQKKIIINQFPLSDKKNKYLLMRENQFVEGGALNSFNENLNFEGKKINTKYSYNIYGTTASHLLKSKILTIPNYIKIDVDGIEHLILKGFGKFLKNKKIESISVEINENFKDQFKNILILMKKNNFKIIKKEKSFLDVSKKFEKTYNYIFGR